MILIYAFLRSSMNLNIALDQNKLDIVSIGSFFDHLTNQESFFGD